MILIPWLLLIFYHCLTFFYFKHKDAQAKVEYVKRLHEQVKALIAKKNEIYAKQANKNRKEVVLELGNWVWVHMRKERFPKQRKS